MRFAERESEDADPEDGKRSIAEWFKDTWSDLGTY